MRIDKNTTIKLGDRNIIKIKIGDSVIWEKKTEPEIDYFYIESLGDGNTISVINKGDGSTNNVTPTLEYSKDKKTWNTITFDWTSGTHTTNLPILNTGEKMYFRNDTRLFSNSSSKYISFSSSVISNVGGDIRTLSNYLDVDNETTPQSYMFFRLFYQNGKIVDASDLRLPYTTLANRCYYQIFKNCTSLTTPPSLPATKLTDYCYEEMFYGCSKLTTPPELPATTLTSGCYICMFFSCTNLTTPPSLPAIKLTGNCYEFMFYGCTNLTTPPSLPATTLASSCYKNMFDSCTSLTTSPSLPATTLASSCYYQMFYGCTKINSITVYADDISATNCTKGWLSGVASTGTLHNLGSATYTKDSVSGIPTGWTEVKS